MPRPQPVIVATGTDLREQGAYGILENGRTDNMHAISAHYDGWFRIESAATEAVRSPGCAGERSTGPCGTDLFPDPSAFQIR